MKRKFTAAVAATLSIALCLGTFTACNFFATEPDGRTPYDVAVSEGYEGTREEWLAQTEGNSSRERKWYEEAVASGEFEGTFTEFLKQIDVGADVAKTALSSAVSVYAMFPASYMLGAGVIYSLDQDAGSAYIVTNYHVLYSKEEKGLSEKIYVYLSEHETFVNGMPGNGAIEATFVGGTMSYDLAVLQVTGVEELKGPAYRAVQTCNSDAVVLGESVYAVGNAIGHGLSVTRGVVSATREEVTALTADGLSRVTLPEIRTDAAINHGNSGGGLFNSQGQLVGIVNARLETEYANGDGNRVDGFGYALPLNFAYAAVENILANEGACRLARLGLDIRTLSETKTYDETSEKWNIEEKLVVFSTTDELGAGYKAGLRNGDTLISASITHKDGSDGGSVAFTRRHKLDDFLLRVCKGDTLTVVVSREEEEKTIQIHFDRDEYFTSVL